MPTKRIFQIVGPLAVVMASILPAKKVIRAAMRFLANMDQVFSTLAKELPGQKKLLQHMSAKLDNVEARQQAGQPYNNDVYRSADAYIQGAKRSLTMEERKVLIQCFRLKQWHPGARVSDCDKRRGQYIHLASLFKDKHKDAAVVDKNLQAQVPFAEKWNKIDWAALKDKPAELQSACDQYGKEQQAMQKDYDGPLQP